MPFYDLSADSQSHTRPVVFTPAVETMKRLEDALEILFIKSDPIILYDQVDLTFRWIFCPHLNHGRDPFPVVFQTISNQVLEQLVQLQGVTPDDR